MGRQGGDSGLPARLHAVLSRLIIPLANSMLFTIEKGGTRVPRARYFLFLLEGFTLRVICEVCFSVLRMTDELYSSGNVGFLVKFCCWEY